MVKRVFKSLIEAVLDSLKKDSDEHIKITQNAVGKNVNQIGVQSNNYKEKRSKSEQ